MSLFCPYVQSYTIFIHLSLLELLLHKAVFPKVSQPDVTSHILCTYHTCLLWLIKRYFNPLTSILHIATHTSTLDKKLLRELLAVNTGRKLHWIYLTNIAAKKTKWKNISSCHHIITGSTWVKFALLCYLNVNTDHEYTMITLQHIP